jgi:hypothetical protein
MKVSILPEKVMRNDALVGVARDVIVRPFMFVLSGLTLSMIVMATGRFGDGILSFASINLADRL